VINRPDIEGSIVDVQLFVSLKDAKPDVQKEYDVASLGEIESVLDLWRSSQVEITYKAKVSAKAGDWIRPKP
jgi:hypothetical protein